MRDSIAAQSVADRLIAATGMDGSSLEDSRLKSIIDARCRQLRLADAGAYVARLDGDSEELEELIDATVIRETRFFRDPAVFEHIRMAAVQLAGEFPGVLRVLSAPCSTGQESYSLAATLQQAGLPLSRFAIDAFDISQVALTTARAAAYPEETIRLSPAARAGMETVARLEDKQWRIHDGLRHRVHFERRNLAEAGALGTEPMYHLVLCRNLFIYLAPAARAALAKSLADALIPGGRLVIGTADRVEELSAVFSPLKPAASFAFVHRDLTMVKSPTRSSAMGPRRPAVKAVQPLGKPAADRAAAPAPEPAHASAAAMYQRAVRDWQHDDLRRAERRCRQALYLDPKFLPALELLQTLWLQHPNLRVRDALDARIDRTRSELPAVPPDPLETSQKEAV